MDLQDIRSPVRIVETDQASEFEISKGNRSDNIDARSKLLR